MSSIVVHALEEFSKTMRDTLTSSFAAECEMDKSVQIIEQIESEKDFYVSLMITGTVYGEFLVAVNRLDAIKMVNPDFVGDASLISREMENEIVDVFCEVLNIASGIVLPLLKKDGFELSLTAPKAFVGRAFYPNVKSLKQKLDFKGAGNIECYFYLDEMELDIAKSYKDALSKLYVHYKKLEDANAKLQDQQLKLVHAEKMSSLGTLSAGVAHNINTPLGTILLNCDSLEEEIQSEEMDKVTSLQYVDSIAKTANRISDIIKRLRGFSKEGAVADFREESLKPLISELQEYFMDKAKMTQLQLDNPLNDNFQLECAGREIITAFTQLLDNAIEYVESSNLDQKQVSLHVSEDESKCQFILKNRVEDDFDLDFSKIYDPFFTTKGASFHGLGLSIAMGVVEGHGGTIHAEHSEGNFIVTLVLPKKQHEAGRVDKPPSAA